MVLFKFRLCSLCFSGLVALSPLCMANELSNSTDDAEILGGTPLEDVPTYLGYKYYSGNIGTLGDFPTMYTSSVGITIVGKGYNKTFPTSEFDEAMRAYKAFLVLRGYEVSD